MTKMIALSAALLFTFAGAAHAQSAYGQAEDAAADGAYATSSDSRSDEDSSDNAGAVFDGTPTSGVIEDPTTLQPRGTVAVPNE